MAINTDVIALILDNEGTTIYEAKTTQTADGRYSFNWPMHTIKPGVEYTVRYLHLTPSDPTRYPHTDRGKGSPAHD